MFDRNQIQILDDHVDHTRFHIVEIGCQMVQLLPAYIVGPTMFVNLAPALIFITLFLMASYEINQYIQRDGQVSKKRESNLEKMVFYISQVNNTTF